MLASQQPSQVMKAVYANTFIKIFGNLSSGRELESIAEAMGLKGGGCTCSAVYTARATAQKRSSWVPSGRL